MAHKTKIGDSYYEVTGGKAMIGTDIYEIKGGKTKIGNDIYSINFGLQLGTMNTGLSQISDIAYGGGYIVAVGITSETTAAISYATNLEGPWAVKSIWTGDDEIINTVHYDNGYWVVGGHHYTDSNSTQYARIAYTTNPTGTWTVKDLWSGTGTYNTVKDITYANGYWALCGIGYNYATMSTYHYWRIAYTTNITSDWTTKDLSQGYKTYESPQQIIYTNGYWVTAGSRFPSSSSSNRNACYQYTTNITGNWTYQAIWSGGGSEITRMMYSEGYWIAFGLYCSSNYYVRIAYSTDITSGTGEWIEKSLRHGNVSGRVDDFEYINGYYVGIYYIRNREYVSGVPTVPDSMVWNEICQRGIVYSSDITATWSSTVIGEEGTLTRSCISDIEGNYVIGDHFGNIIYSSDVEDFKNL